MLNCRLPASYKTFKLSFGVVREFTSFRSSVKNYACTVVWGDSASLPSFRLTAGHTRCTWLTLVAPPPPPAKKIYSENVYLLVPRMEKTGLYNFSCWFQKPNQRTKGVALFQTSDIERDRAPSHVSLPSIRRTHSPPPRLGSFPRLRSRSEAVLPHLGPRSVLPRSEGRRSLGRRPPLPALEAPVGAHAWSPVAGRSGRDLGGSRMAWDARGQGRGPAEPPLPRAPLRGLSSAKPPPRPHSPHPQATVESTAATPPEGTSFPTSTRPSPGEQYLSFAPRQSQGAGVTPTRPGESDVGPPLRGKSAGRGPPAPA